MIMTRWRRLTHQRFLMVYVMVSLCIVLSCVLIWVTRQEAVSVFGSHQTNDSAVATVFPRWTDVLSAGLPGLAVVINQQTQPTQPTEITAAHLTRGTVKVLTDVDITDIRSILSGQIPLLAMLAPDPQSVVVAEVKRPIIQFNPKLVSPVSKPLVAIYHTHTSESFVPTSGVTHSRGGQAGEIVAVGDALVQQLAKYKINSIHSKQIHDYPSFMKAYGPSEITVKKILADNPSVQVVLDIHRDAEKRNNSIVEVNGAQVARIAIIVAVGQEDLVQPHWPKNLAFAELIQQKMDAYYPGLSRGLHKVEWRYNQHLHERALLLEVGSHEVSLEEAERSMELMGGILAEILAENKNFGVQ